MSDPQPQIDPNPFRKGERIRATLEGRTVDATVILASQNGRSLAIAFEAILGGYVGMMPILQDDAGIYRGLVDGTPVTLTRYPA